MKFAVEVIAWFAGFALTRWVFPAQDLKYLILAAGIGFCFAALANKAQE